MKNTASKKENLSRIFADRIFSICGVLSSFSKQCFHEVYLFEWTAAHYYLCLWVASVTFCFLEMYRAALITTAGNWTGIFDRTSVGRFYYQNKRHKNQPGYVYRKSMAAQGTLRSFDLATRFPTFVYYRNDC